jgi:hypothetical protein
MDVFAHSAISYLGFGRKRGKKNIILAMIFGILPDLLSWTIYLFYVMIFGGFRLMRYSGTRHMVNIPDWTNLLYSISHSMIIYLAIILAIWIIFRNIPLYLYAWGGHILVDIPTHSREFLPTPFLWPISDWHFPGISWATPWFFASIWVGIIFWYAIIKIREKRKKK